jgi:hypothetical protein
VWRKDGGGSFATIAEEVGALLIHSYQLAQKKAATEVTACLASIVGSN